MFFRQSARTVRHLLRCSALVLIAGALTAHAEAPPVWVIGEGFRVDPLTGRVLEERRIDGNPIPAAFDYMHQNLAWDSRRAVVTLAGARNEFVAYQVLIHGPAKQVNIACSELKGPSTIAASDIEVFKEWYVNVTANSSSEDSTTAGYNLGRGWYPDALLPVNAATNGFGQPFDIPDRLNAIPSQQWQAIWVDIYVPKTAAPGDYNGALTITGQGIPKRSLQVSLKVYDVALSDDYALEVGLNNYGSIGQKGSDLRLRYYQMARRHRMAIHEHYIAPKVEGAGNSMHAVWDTYDGEMAKYFTGAAFSAKYGYHGPGEGKPLRWVYLPFEILPEHEWPMPGTEHRTPEYQAAVRAMLRDFSKHIEDKHWTSTNLMFFVNGLDEPTSSEALDDIRYFGDLEKSVNPPRVYYRTDINHLHNIGELVSGWTEQMMFEKLAPVVDLWVSVADFQRTDFSVLLNHRRQKPRNVVWFYQNREPSVGGYTLDDETIGLATWPVIAWKYSLDGCVLWECTYTGVSKNVWVDPNNNLPTNGGRVENLPALMMYPVYPGKPGVPEPVPSIRLKSFRRGAQDYEYLRLLETATSRDATMKRLNRVLGDCLSWPHRPYGAAGDWSHNPEDWNKFRRDLLQSIAAK